MKMTMTARPLPSLSFRKTSVCNGCTMPSSRSIARFCFAGMYSNYNYGNVWQTRLKSKSYLHYHRQCHKSHSLSSSEIRVSGRELDGVLRMGGNQGMDGKRRVATGASPSESGSVTKERFVVTTPLFYVNAPPHMYDDNFDPICASNYQKPLLS